MNWQSATRGFVKEVVMMGADVPDGDLPPKNADSIPPTWSGMDRRALLGLGGLGLAALTFKDLFAASPSFALSEWVGGWTRPLDQALSVNTGFLGNECGYPEFGGYVSGQYHTGLDLQANSPSPVRAIGVGTVFGIQDSGWDVGSAVYVQHTASDGTQFLSVYGHISRAVGPGDSITAGQLVGTVAPWPNSAHLHFGIRTSLGMSGRNGSQSCGTWPYTNDYVNPEPFLAAHPASGVAQIVDGDEELMRYIAESTSTDGVIPSGMSFIQGAAGPLRPLSQLEDQAYEFWNTHGIPIRTARWSGDQIRAVTIGAGLLEWSGIPNNVPTLTGRVIYASAATATYPKVTVA